MTKWASASTGRAQTRRWGDTQTVNAGRVRTLHYAVNWVDQHPVTWLEDAFPASYEVGGWTLSLSEARLDAVPSRPMSEDEARSALTPILDTWSAAIEVEQRLVMTFFYLGADVEQETAGAGTAASADFASASGTAFDATVAIRRGTPPEPDWSWRDTDVTRLARSMCLRPLRNRSRTVDDAAYWLSTHLKSWAGSDRAAAERLNVSSGYFDRARQWGARSAERKVSRDSQALSMQEKEQLKSVLEELIRRLHLVESDLAPGRHLDVNDWPAS